MALATNDLFMVQDGSTLSMHKVTLGTLTTSVASGISYDGTYVNDTGDNMTGDLTLGPTGTAKITFSATNGDGNFTGTLYANYVRAATSITGTGGLLIYGDTSSTNGIELQSDGDVIIGADVTANAFIGDGSGLTNLNVPAGLWEISSDNLSPVGTGNSITEIVDITMSGNLVATGTLEAEGIDGGSYN